MDQATTPNRLAMASGSGSQTQTPSPPALSYTSQELDFIRRTKNIIDHKVQQLELHTPKIPAGEVGEAVSLRIRQQLEVGQILRSEIQVRALEVYIESDFKLRKAITKCLEHTLNKQKNADPKSELLVAYQSLWSSGDRLISTLRHLDQLATLHLLPHQIATPSTGSDGRSAG